MFRPVFVTLAAKHVFHAAFAHDGAHVDMNYREGSENDGAADVNDESQECTVLRQSSEKTREQQEQAGHHQSQTEDREGPEEGFLTGVSKTGIRVLGFASEIDVSAERKEPFAVTAFGKLISAPLHHEDNRCNDEWNSKDVMEQNAGVNQAVEMGRRHHGSQPNFTGADHKTGQNQDDARDGCTPVKNHVAHGPALNQLAGKSVGKFCAAVDQDEHRKKNSDGDDRSED